MLTTKKGIEPYGKWNQATRAYLLWVGKHASAIIEGQEQGNTRPSELSWFDEHEAQQMLWEVVPIP